MTTVFDSSSVPPPGGSTEFSPQVWEKVRSRGIAPSSVGALNDSPKLRAEFLAGARLLGFELVDLDDLEAVAALHDREIPLDALQPQQLITADALNAGMRKTIVEEPRRSSKTTTILAWALGRCVSRPRYKVTFSAQTGAMGVQALDDWARDMLDRVNPPDDLDIPPWLRGVRTKPKAQQRAEALFGMDAIPFDNPTTAGRGFRILRGNTKAGIYFDNGSSLVVVRPEASAYRGRAADVSWIDEAQEIDPDASDDLLAGILPLQDTRPGSMVVVSGTAGEARVGLMWKLLDQLRAGDPTIGGIDYAAPEETPWEVIEDEDAAMELLKRWHPGVDTLTTIEQMRDNYRSFSLPKWAREYLSIWPETFGVAVVDPTRWADGKLKRFPPRPQRVAFGFAIKPGGSVGCIAVAWRNSSGIAYVEVVDHRQGTSWMGAVAQHLSKTYRGSTIAYDDIGEGKATATELARLTPKPRLRVQTYTEIAAGCVQILRDIERGLLRHSDQAMLNDAIAHTAKRQVRGNDRGIWLWTPTEDGADITPLDAATRALRNWDQHFARSGGRAGVVTAA